MPTTTNIAVHEISFRGKSGAIFMLIVFACVCYVIGFATPNWKSYSNTNEGLWERCNCYENNHSEGWFHATQAMIIIGLIGLCIALLLIALYMCVHSVSKNSTIIGLVITCFLTVIFMVIGFVLYGVKEDHQSWSYALCIIGSVLTFVAGILSFLQMRDSGVRI